GAIRDCRSRISRSLSSGGASRRSVGSMRTTIGRPSPWQFLSQSGSLNPHRQGRSHTEMSISSQTSVVIAGAGPVGLGLACELGLRGIDCLLVEKRGGSVTVPKQSMVSARNMEFCRRWGVAAAVRNAVWPQSFPRDFVYLDNLRGRELMRVK